MHQHHVHRDTMEPRRELRLASEVLQASIDLDEDLLDDVVEIGGRTEHAPNETRNVALVAVEQRSKRRGLTGCGAAHEAVFVGHVRACRQARGYGQHWGGGGRSHGGFVARRFSGIQNLARNRHRLDAGPMAIVALTLVLGVVLFDAHDFVNRRRRT
jgi:hypothetical protein